MIQSLSAVDSSQEIAKNPKQFRLNPPSYAALLASVPAAISANDSGITVEWMSESQPSAGQAATHLMDEIVSRCRRVVAKYPANARALADLGIALLNRGDLDAAAPELEKALVSEPNH